jgi:hypothetical protein
MTLGNMRELLFGFSPKELVERGGPFDGEVASPAVGHRCSLTFR